MTSSCLCAERLANSQLEALCLNDELALTRIRHKNALDGVKPVLDVVDGGDVTLPGDRRSEEEKMHLRCQEAWGAFRVFCREAAEYAARHVLGVVRSHYPRIKLDVVSSGWVLGTSDEAGDHLMEESREAAEEMAKDIHLCPLTP
ncbi:MAG TPA: hypothetical protein VFM05_06060 [Candidatus Saccharimonadales bacterium]|nr:hypothetical protein [Candidatus Saccharimonadales bacterium]